MRKLRHNLENFVKDRNWQDYHSPKNLSMALIVETAELIEIFQWMTQEESRKVNSKNLQAIKDEIGDIQIYLTMIADKFGLCPIKEAKRKIKKNEIKYPLDKGDGVL